MAQGPYAVEINFDGIVGPSHNYAGLSLGNLASARNLGSVSHPRAAALQGLAKMRANLALGLTQGFFLPQRRPNDGWLEQLGTSVRNAAPHLRANALSASSMWAANAATVSPGFDTADGRCHLTVANLMTMPHRSHEWRETLQQLQFAFSHTEHFVIHEPVPPPFGDEGAANHMRLCRNHTASGVEIFVYGKAGGPFPARQHRQASEAIARIHGLSPQRTIFVQQSDAAIAAGAFHNDVVAVANERVLFTHESAFADAPAFYASLRAHLPEVHIVEVPEAQVSLADAIQSYLFNAQLVTLTGGDMALILPAEARETPSVWRWLEQHIKAPQDAIGHNSANFVSSNSLDANSLPNSLPNSGGSPIRHLFVHDLRESMANGGGPACLRLRVVADPGTVDPRFIATPEKLDWIEAVVTEHWPENIATEDLAQPALWQTCQSARTALCKELGLAELI